MNYRDIFAIESSRMNSGPDRFDVGNGLLEQVLAVTLAQPRQVIGRNANRVRGIGSTPPRSVNLVYQQITGKRPGISGSPVTEGYMTPFEELWLTSLKLVKPNSTLEQAREIYRVAAGRRNRQANTV